MKLALKKTDNQSENSTGGVFGFLKRGVSKHKRLVAVVLILALAVSGGWYFLSPGQNSAAAVDLTYTTAQVERRDISSEITGSGTLQAANSYSVTSLVDGSILTDGFEEGDQVEEGVMLYTIDSSDTASSLEQAQVSLEQSQRNYDKQLNKQADLIITAPATGRIYSLDVEVGDEINAGQSVAVIRDTDTMSLIVNFPADDGQSFYVGQGASVTLDSTFETLSGTISKISGNDTVLSGNVIVRAVTIDVNNPGGLSTSQSASGAVGTVTSTGSGTFTYRAEETVTADLSGQVTSISVAEGSKVTKGQTLIVTVSDDLDETIQNASESVRNSELSLENQYDRLDDYTITSPISGTVVDKNYKAGETAESNQVLCTIYDLSYLTMTLSVDELDISSIQVGQVVSLTADAVEGQSYEGIVTKVSVAGTSSSGVTTYPVTIRLDETAGLLPGMSADATIQLESASDVLTIPTAALTRGNQVLVTADSPSAANAVSAGGAEPEGGQSTSGYVSVEVTIGVSDDSYMEVLHGLQEGDVVAYIETSSSSENTMGMMGGVSGGGMSGGGMPSGGGGGMPGGGMGGF